LFLNKDELRGRFTMKRSWWGTPMRIELHDLVDDVMRIYPKTIRVFLDFKMACVGCPIAGFHTVADACAEHDIDSRVLLKALHDAAEGRR
jgi:hybrid cluster-associated redox disulfide protein